MSLFGDSSTCASIDGIAFRPFDHGTDEPKADCFAMDKKASHGIFGDVELHWNTWKSPLTQKYSDALAREAIFEGAGHHLYLYFSQFYKTLRPDLLQIYEALTQASVRGQGDTTGDTLLATMAERSKIFEAKIQMVLKMFVARKLLEGNPNLLCQVEIIVKLQYGEMLLLPDVTRQMVHTAACLQYRARIMYTVRGDCDRRESDIVCGVYIGKSEAVGPLPEAGTVYPLSCTCGSATFPNTTPSGCLDTDQSTSGATTPDSSHPLSICGDGHDT